MRKSDAPQIASRTQGHGKNESQTPSSVFCNNNNNNYRVTQTCSDVTVQETLVKTQTLQEPNNKEDYQEGKKVRGKQS